MTEVRLFAALRDAAGTARYTTDATTLASLLAEARERFGPLFAQRLSVSTVVADGEPVDRAADLELEPVSEVALLPPFSGG